MKTQSKLILATALSFVLLSANTAMASENGHANDDNHHTLMFNGGNESDASPAMEVNKDAEHHKLKLNGGSESDASPKVSTQTDLEHHKEATSTDPTSIDYMGNK